MKVMVGIMKVMDGFLALVFCLVMTSDAFAVATASRGKSFVDGEVIRSSEVNAEINVAVNWINNVLLGGSNYVKIANGDSLIVLGTMGADTVRVDSRLWVANGSSSLLSIGWTLDPNSGWYRAGSDSINFVSGGTVRWGSQAGSIVYNDPGADYNFRIEGDAVDSLFYIDAGNDDVHVEGQMIVGAGTTAPTANMELTVQGQMNVTDSLSTDTLTVENRMTMASGSYARIGTSDITAADSITVTGIVTTDSANVTGNTRIAGTARITATTDITAADSITATGIVTTDSLKVTGNADFTGPVEVGEASEGHDVIFHGDTNGKEMTWDQSEDKLIIDGDLQVTGTSTITGTTSLSGSTNNTIATVTGANALIGEANLTFDGSALDLNGGADISGDLTLSAGGDGALTFGTAGENSIKIPDAQASALIIEETNAAYLTFVTSDGGEKITVGKKLEAGSVEIEGSAFDIDGGSIDGVTLGGASAVTVTDADINGGTLDGVAVGGASAAAGTFTTVTAGGNVRVNDNSNNDMVIVDNDGTGTGIQITQDGNAGASDYALHIQSTVAQTNGELFWIDHDHASSTSDVTRVRNDGTGHSVYVTANGVLATDRYALHLYSNAAQTNEPLMRVHNDNASSTQPVAEFESDNAESALMLMKGQAGSYDSGGGKRQANIHSGGALIADDDVLEIYSNNGPDVGTLILNVQSGASLYCSAMIAFGDYGGARHTTIASSADNITLLVATSDYSGTTGADGSLTVTSPENSGLEIENRLGDSAYIQWIILH